MAFEFPAIDPVALQIGPLALRWYALAYLAGILLGWRYALYYVGQISGRPNKEDIDDFITWLVIGIILGGRLGYVFFYNFDFYWHNPFVDVMGLPFPSTLAVWEGGMAFHGGLLGVFCAMVLYARAQGFSFFKLADVTTIAAAIGLFFGRVANFINGELYGRVTDVSWAVVFPNAGPEPRHPSQLYEALFEGIILFALLHIYGRTHYARSHAGSSACLFLIGYGVFRFLIEYTREPDAQLGFVLGSLSMGQLLCAPMILIGLAVFFIIHKKDASS